MSTTMNYYGQQEPQQPQTNSLLSGTKAFMESNSAISNFAFVILIVIGFMIILQMGINFIQYMFFPKNDIRLIKGMTEANNKVEIEQNPNKNGSKPIYRSSDEPGGMEFSYSLWMYVEKLNETHELTHVFHKGEENYIADEGEYKLTNGDIITPGMNFPNNGPGLYLRKTTTNDETSEFGQAELITVLNTYPDETDVDQSNHITEQVSIGNIPLHNWVLVTIIVRGRNLDVYINGNIARRHVLSGVAKQNYGNIYAGSNGGFEGKLSNLTYYNEAIGTRKIYSILRMGPDLRMVNNANLLNKKFDYLSLSWFLGRNQDGNM